MPENRHKSMPSVLVCQVTAGSALVAEAHAVKLTGVTHQSFIRGGNLTTSNRPGSLCACGAYTFLFAVWF